MTSSLLYVIIPADGSAMVPVTCEPVSPDWTEGTTGRMDYLGGKAAGDLLENGYIYACANGCAYVQVFNIFNNNGTVEQDKDYSFAVAGDESWAQNTETSAAPVAAMDMAEGNAPAFVARNRSVNGFRYSDGENAMTVMTDEEGNTIGVDGAATNTNFATFTVNGEIYAMVHAAQDGVRSHAWVVKSLKTGKEIVRWDMPAGEAVNYMSGLAASVNEDGTVNLFSYMPGIRLAKYTLDLGGSSAIEEIAADNAPVEYYNLQGVKVANPENGIFVKKQGTKATKVVL